MSTHRRHQEHGHVDDPASDDVDECTIDVDAMTPELCTPGHAGEQHEADHVHGAACGHEPVPHGDHIDYVVDGRLHHPHGTHCDDHGTLVD